MRPAGGRQERQGEVTRRLDQGRSGKRALSPGGATGHRRSLGVFRNVAEKSDAQCRRGFPTSEVPVAHRDQVHAVITKRPELLDCPKHVGEAAQIGLRDHKDPVGGPQQLALPGSSRLQTTTIDQEIGICCWEAGADPRNLLIKRTRRVPADGSDESFEAARQRLQVGRGGLLVRRSLPIRKDQARHSGALRQGEACSEVPSGRIALGNDDATLRGPDGTQCAKQCRHTRGALRRAERKDRHDSGATRTRATCPAAEALATRGANVEGSMSETIVISEVDEEDGTVTSVTVALEASKDPDTAPDPAEVAPTELLLVLPIEESGEPGGAVRTTSTLWPGNTPAAGSWPGDTPTPTTASPGRGADAVSNSARVRSVPARSGTATLRPRTPPTRAAGIGVIPPATETLTTERSRGPNSAPCGTFRDTERTGV